MEIIKLNKKSRGVLFPRLESAMQHPLGSHYAPNTTYQFLSPSDFGGTN